MIPDNFTTNKNSILIQDGVVHSCWSIFWMKMNMKFEQKENIYENGQKHDQNKNVNEKNECALPQIHTDTVEKNGTT